MTTAKPRYSGERIRGQVLDFSDYLCATLSEFMKCDGCQNDAEHQCVADSFVTAILAEARWAISEMHWQRLDCTKAELRAERDDLYKRVKELEHRLRILSPDFDYLLGVDADPINCADTLSKLAVQIEGVEAKIQRLPKFKSLVQKEHFVAVELSIRVLRVLKKHGIKPSVTGDMYFNYTSDAVQILNLIGDDIKLVRDKLTWRDIIAEAKDKAPDLK